MFAAFNAGDIAQARAIHARLLPSFAFLNSEDCVFSMSIKAMLNTLGHHVGDCRLPLPPPPPDKAVQARAVWQELQVI